MYIEELSKSMNNNKYFGTDFSRNAVKDVSGRNTNVKYFVSDSMIVPIRDNSVDVLLLLDIVEHVDKPEKVFTEAKRILKDDGIIHLNIPVEANKTTIFWLLGKIFKKNFQKKYSGHIHSYSLDGVKFASNIIKSIKKYSDRADYVFTRDQFVLNLVTETIDPSEKKILIYASLLRLFHF